jgi:holo-[acyl-carrier protein] synthase
MQNDQPPDDMGVPPGHYPPESEEARELDEVGASAPGVLAGIDLIEVARIQQTLERFGERFLHRVYTSGEVTHCAHNIQRLAARFAAKEAAIKVLGTGIEGVGWRDCEVVSLPNGKPTLSFHGNAAHRAAALGITAVDLSLSHTREHAMAVVVALTKGI